MKLEKREITLNEADSLKDILYMERLILLSYGGKAFPCQRKEVANELVGLKKQAEEDEKRILSLWQKSQKEQEIFK